MGLHELFHMTTVVRTPDRVEIAMPITPDLFQPHGLLHGGVTIALLETCASYGAEERTDFDRELPFGLETTIRHRKPGRSGLLHGVAEIDHEEPSYGGRKQFWHVVATDDEGDVVSEGTFVTKIVTLEHLAEKERARKEAQSK